MSPMTEQAVRDVVESGELSKAELQLLYLLTAKPIPKGVK